MDDRWRSRAACLGMDTDLFLSAGQGLVPVEALRVCVGCPVRDDCLSYALKMSEYDDSGVWGGTTEGGRRKIRYGKWSRAQAFAVGDQLAARPTAAERSAA